MTKQRAGYVCGRPRAQGVANDAVGEDVLERRQVELAGERRMLREVREPELVRCGGREVSLHEIVAHSRSWGLAGNLLPLLGRRRPDPVLLADPVHAVLADLMTPVLELISQEAIAEGRVVEVQVEQFVGEVSVVPVAHRHRLSEPLVVRLASKAQHPAGQHDGEPLVGQLSDQR